MDKPQYGETQEGVVVKIAPDFDVSNKKAPTYLKIVKEDFRETKIQKLPKNISPEIKLANELADSVVTEARVMKKLNELIAEGTLPETLTIKDMGVVVKHLPKVVHADIKVEEPEIYNKLGSLDGKLIGKKTITLVKKMLLR